MKIIKVIFSSVIFIYMIYSCQSEPLVIPVDDQIGALPEFVIAPVDNQITPQRIELGRVLFWDPILSGTKDVSCATCHHPNDDYAELLELSRGVGATGLSENRTGGALVKRNAPTIINTAFNGIDVNGNYDPSNTVMFWDNRSASLEEQALQPIRSMEEMRGTEIAVGDILDTIVTRLNNIEEYRLLFDEAYGSPVITRENLAKAIATFERSIIANNSPFDQFARGDEGALTALQVRGMQAFINSNCTNCHSGPMFSDYELHNLGVPQNDQLPQPDNGVNGEFRTPTLRNLVNTAPYFHNGTSGTLEAAVEFYDGDPETDPDAQGVDVDDAEVDAIVAFIESLQDDNFDRVIPASVPSGLPVGGNIQ